MSKGLTLDIAANTRDFQRGTKDVEGALEGVADSLDDVSRDGDKAADKLAQSFSEAQRDISKDAKKIGRDVKKDAGGSFEEAGEKTKAFKEEATANFQEVASSFDGSMESIVDGAQGTLGGLATAIGGPTGLALAALGAVGGAALTSIIASSEEMKEKVTENFEQMVENGTAQLTGLQENQKIATAITEQWDKIKQISELTGAPVENVARALALGGDSAERLQEALNKTQAETGRSPIVRNLVNDLEKVIQSEIIAKERYADYERATSIGANKQGERLTAIAKQYENMPKTIKTSFDVDTTSLDAALRKPRNIAVELVTRSGKKVPW